MQKKTTQLIELIIFVLGYAGVVLSFLLGWLNRYVGTPYLTPIGGLIVSGGAFLILRRLSEQYPKNPYIADIAKFLKVVIIAVGLFFGVSLTLMPFYQRSLFGEKTGGSTDSIVIHMQDIRADSIYKIKAEINKISSMQVLFFIDDESVEELKVSPSFTVPLGNKNNTVDRLTVQSTIVEAKKKGYMFKDVHDANGCDIKLGVVLSYNQPKAVRVDIQYTYYYLSKWQEILRWLLERYYT